MENISSLLAHDEFVMKVQCGAAFTIARTNKNNCISWGWADYGVLGRGKGIVTSEPSMISSLGTKVEDRYVALLERGMSQHVST